MAKAFEKPVLNVEDMPTTKFGEQNGETGTSIKISREEVERPEKINKRAAEAN